MLTPAEKKSIRCSRYKLQDKEIRKKCSAFSTLIRLICNHMLETDFSPDVEPHIFIQLNTTYDKGAKLFHITFRNSSQRTCL